MLVLFRVVGEALRLPHGNYVNLSLGNGPEFSFIRRCRLLP